MKFRSFIIISALALLALLFVQYYFINETFITKQEQFNDKYKSLTKLGLYEYENQFLDPVEDSIFVSLDAFAGSLVFGEQLQYLASFHDSVYTKIRDNISSNLDKATGKDVFLEEYIRKQGEPNSFSAFHQVQKMELLAYGSSGSFLNDSLLPLPEKHPNALLVRSYTIERNFFRLTYNYYIDFPFRNKQIVRASYGTIALSALTILIVFAVFTLTLRNLLIQKRLSDMKTDFINNMTHELKTPLSTISVASSSLALNKGQMEQAKVQVLSETIKRQNKLLTKLIERILDISIWEKDQVKVHRNKLKVSEFMTELSENFKNANPDIKFEYYSRELDKDLRFSMDEIHMTTVVNNLLSNAKKYGGQKPEIHMSVVCGNTFKLTIRDEGPGISKEEQKHIFEKFYRGERTKKEAIRGLGLGLYYVKQIVEAHGGSITLKSKKGAGTEFLIEIPQ